MADAATGTGDDGDLISETHVIWGGEMILERSGCQPRCLSDSDEPLSGMDLPSREECEDGSIAVSPRRS